MAIYIIQELLVLPVNNSKVLENMLESDLAVCRKKLLDDSFEAQLKNNSQYGWASWKKESFEWWVRQELEYYKKHAEIATKNKSRMVDLLRGVYSEEITKLSDETLDIYFTEIYDANGGLKLTSLGLIWLFCFNGGRFEDLF